MAKLAVEITFAHHHNERLVSDGLRSDEVALTERAIAALGSVDWAQPIVRRLQEAGGITPENKPRMFEVRVEHDDSA